MLQPHTIRSAQGATHRVKRIGRGNASGHGTYSTRGGKGQTARSGGSRGLKRLGFRALMQQTPKLRGFKSLAVRPAEINLDVLEQAFAVGETVTLAALAEKGLVKAHAQSAKILGTGQLSKKLFVTGVAATSSAAAAIKAAGGQVK